MCLLLLLPLLPLLLLLHCYRLVTRLSAQPIHTMCVNNMSDATNDLVADYVSPQRAGTCFYRSVLMGARYLLRLRGRSRDCVKRVTLAIRREYMDRVAAALRRDTLAPLDTSDVLLIELGCKQTAHAALKARTAKRLTDEEVAELLAQLQSVRELVKFRVCWPHSGVRRSYLTVEMGVQAVGSSADESSRALALHDDATYHPFTRFDAFAGGVLNLTLLEGADKPRVAVRHVDLLADHVAVHNAASTLKLLQAHEVRRGRVALVIIAAL